MVGTQPTSIAEMDLAIARLQSQKDRWARTTVRDRIRFLDAIVGEYISICEEWVQLGLSGKRAYKDVYALGWEWAGGPVPILRFLTALKHTLLSIEKTGCPPRPGNSVTRSNGQVSVQVYPSNLYERLTTPGISAEIWMDPDLPSEDAFNWQAAADQSTEPVGRVCLVLGAGNVSAIPVNDTLSKLFIDNTVVLLKMNPVNEYLGPLIEKAFRPLISEGCFQVVYGGVSEGAYLCSHPGIDCLHLTGSDRTYEAIVFGPGPEGLRHKIERAPISDKPFTAELGNIAPAIIVPGPWSKADLHHQAEQLASHLCDAGSYSCSRTRVIVQYSNWAFRRDLLREIKTVLSQVPPRADFYPGAADQYKRFLTAHPNAQILGIQREGALPWTLIPDIDSRSEEEICFQSESFCPVLAETGLEASSTADFVFRAVDFANQRLWGTLSASLIVHPHSLRDPEVVKAIEWAIEQLHFGTVAVNCLPGLAWGLMVTPWGSYPGNDPWDIQSGTGFVHNAYMYSHTQKTVLRGPFRTWPLPPWFPSRSDKMGKIFKRVAEYEASPSAGRMLAIILSALR